MPTFEFKQKIKQLEKRKGGYYYLKIDAAIVNQLERKRATRLICIIDDKLSYQCGLNHLGDGNFYVILATAKLKSLGKQLGDEVHFQIKEDPNPLGVAIPEVLEALLEQDADAKSIFESLSDGKKRSLIFSIQKIKNIDLQVEKILAFLEKVS
ncbi:MAG: YdeI/OmpD-associated family protein [Bacteroidota bacterium]